MTRKGPHSVLVIEARFYEDIADELARGAIEELQAHHMAYERLAVPGSLEIALALSLALANGFVGRAGRLPSGTLRIRIPRTLAPEVSSWPTTSRPSGVRHLPPPCAPRMT